ncbi:hypothetical protein ISF_03646 [Cordyceps fumosorosea ARSEF 2679]|uniref:Uncharacterized protein n=1 Tax=Cordyceps fumosorosea (strain ARSEF 2679) TaxID=1081104 RepID=A0A167ZFZ7_CORFA|nr:hypothetical protein ISF_03646 [Cordyceps fumosorosea ARSEF 2679]OAA67470.1 hypothetical protein ISF_03646 [Cordyceps fumosorosea ARSEF 2679]
MTTLLLCEPSGVAHGFEFPVLWRIAEEPVALERQMHFGGEHEVAADIAGETDLAGKTDLAGETDLGYAWGVEGDMLIQVAGPWDASRFEYHDSADLAAGYGRNSARLPGGYPAAEAVVDADWMMLKIGNGEAAVGRMAGHCADEAA